jgi:hypothetical protein
VKQTFKQEIMAFYEDIKALQCAISDSKNNEVARKVLIEQRSLCIRLFCSRNECQTEDIPELGDCAIISTLKLLGLECSTPTINEYRFNLIELQRRNPTEYFDCFGGRQLYETEQLREIIEHHCSSVSVPGVMTELSEFQAISNTNNAKVIVYCLLIQSNAELEPHVFYPSSREIPLICLCYLFSMTPDPLGSHVQPLYFSQPQVALQLVEATNAQPLRNQVEPQVLGNHVQLCLRNLQVLSDAHQCCQLHYTSDVQSLENQIEPQVLPHTNMLHPPAETSEAKPFAKHVEPMSTEEQNTGMPFWLVQISNAVLLLFSRTSHIILFCLFLIIATFVFRSAADTTHAHISTVVSYANSTQLTSSDSIIFYDRAQGSSNYIFIDATGESDAFSASNIVNVARPKNIESSLSFSHLHGCRIGEASVPGPKTRSASSIAYREKRSSEVRSSIDASQAAQIASHPKSPTRIARFSLAQQEIAVSTVPAQLPDQSPFHESKEKSTTAGLRAASEYFNISNITRQSCACCNERCKARNMKAVIAEGHWLDRLKNRLNWDHTKHMVNEVTKCYYSAPETAVNLKGLPLAPSGIVVDMDGSATVRMLYNSSKYIFLTFLC